jgi:hypothetical protein
MRSSNITATFQGFLCFPMSLKKKKQFGHFFIKTLLPSVNRISLHIADSFSFSFFCLKNGNCRNAQILCHLLLFMSEILQRRLQQLDMATFYQMTIRLKTFGQLGHLLR